MFDSHHHLVIDLETLALTPRAMVRSVGLVFFDPWSDAPPECARLILSPVEQEGREIDPGTVLWWMRQSDKARTSFACERCSRLRDLIHTLEERDSPIVWCKPLHFDVPILLDLLRPHWPSVDAESGPLYRRRVHNARTVYEAASLLGPRINEDPEREGISPDELHDPAVDALLTALTVRRALRALRPGEIIASGAYR